jgi:beta-lactamase regulating signal transducer with metallopeptidase domain
VSALLPILLDASVKATIVLALAAAATLALRRRSAALRHLVWTAAIVAVLVLPVVIAIVPRVAVPLVPRVHVVASANRNDASQAARAADPTPRASDAPADSAPAGPPSSATLLVLAWLAGALVTLAGAAVALARAMALARGAARVTSPPLVAALREAADRLGVSRDVRLASSERATVPFTLGARRPVIVLPAGAERWPEARQRLVVLHEMAHVARRDWTWHLAARLARALHWWNPLAWLAALRLDREREIACDDRVVAAGARPSAYAALLLDSARELRGRVAPPRAALAMVRPSEIERRIVAILDASRRRTALGRARVLALDATAAAVLAGVASLSPAAAPLAPLAAGPAIQARWTDGSRIVGAFARGDVAFAADGRSIASMDRGGWLLVAGWDPGARTLRSARATAPDGEIAWESLDADGGTHPLDAATRAWLDAVLPQTSRRLRPSDVPDDRLTSGSTLTGVPATSDDPTEHVIQARFATAHGAIGFFAKGTVRVDAAHREIRGIDDGGWLFAFEESPTGGPPRVRHLVPGTVSRWVGDIVEWARGIDGVFVVDGVRRSV